MGSERGFVSGVEPAESVALGGLVPGVAGLLLGGCGAGGGGDVVGDHVEGVADTAVALLVLAVLHRAGDHDADALRQLTGEVEGVAFEGGDVDPGGAGVLPLPGLVLAAVGVADAEAQHVAAGFGDGGSSAGAAVRRTK